MDNEDKIGGDFNGVRSRVPQATKTMKRDHLGAQGNIKLSPPRLRTDYLDLYQLLSYPA